nr:NAD-dependent epimerase/dehydratase family protein [Geotalea toluenoxydans]
MKALVTGGGGFLGNAIVRLLMARGDDVRSFSRSEYPELAQLGVEQVQGDLADTERMTTAAAGCDVVFHVAAKAGIWGDHADYHRANVTGTENVLAACRKQAIKRLVYTGSPSVVFDGRDVEGSDESLPYLEHYEAHYPQTKALAEQLVLAANSPSLATVSLRPHLIWAPATINWYRGSSPAPKQASCAASATAPAWWTQFMWTMLHRPICSPPTASHTTAP